MLKIPWSSLTMAEVTQLDNLVFSPPLVSGRFHAGICRGFMSTRVTKPMVEFIHCCIPPPTVHRCLHTFSSCFPNLEQVCCSMSGSNCCFLTCIQVSHEAGKVVWYSHLLKNCPQYIVIYIVKGFTVINEAELDVFLEFSCFFYDAIDVGNFIYIRWKEKFLLSGKKKKGFTWRFLTQMPYLSFFHYKIS